MWINSPRFHASSISLGVEFRGNINWVTTRYITIIASAKIDKMNMPTRDLID
jgi:hypothetical protein